MWKNLMSCKQGVTLGFTWIVTKLRKANLRNRIHLLDLDNWEKLSESSWAVWWTLWTRNFSFVKSAKLLISDSWGLEMDSPQALIHSSINLMKIVSRFNIFFGSFVFGLFFHEAVNPRSFNTHAVSNLQFVDHVKTVLLNYEWSWKPMIREAEMTMKQLENLSPSIMKQVLPLVEQLPPLYMDLVSGRENFTPRPEETKRLIRSYYAVSRNLLIKFKEDMIDETSTLAKVLSSDSSISSMLDMSIRLLPGDHGLPLQQVRAFSKEISNMLKIFSLLLNRSSIKALPDVPPAMADAVNRGGEFLATLTSGTPWETVAKEVSSTLGARPEPNILRADVTKDINLLVNVIMTWLMANTGPRVLKP
ncbi:hypothetical protein M9H77_10423 [Catharanthus roseus]|uniref:Uncharacterized protein n=1 Tax=Catharanthus roseus TaxID=4058 RepID=A0ACC0C3V2_CATRO|nr:hypothetical protein M9H77_10423 [Catharanthus roseus]